MDAEPTREQIEAELLQIKYAASVEVQPAESLDELIARKRKEQGLPPPAPTDVSA